jgi:DNA repair exonuclease SbcCD ATPase subunit
MTPTNIASKIAIAHEASLQERERGRLQLEESLRKSNAALAAEVVQLRERIAELEAESRDFKALGKRCEEAEQHLREVEQQRDAAQLRAELEQARAERDEAVARLGRADFMVDAAFERGRASTLIEQHGSISEVEDKPAPAPAAGADELDRLRALLKRWEAFHDAGSELMSIKESERFLAELERGETLVAASKLRAMAEVWREPCTHGDYDAGRIDCADELLEALANEAAADGEG